MAAETIAKGTVLQRAASGGGSFVTIANIMNISPPNMQRDSLETTKHNDEDRFRTFIPGLIDPGEIQLSVTWDPDDTTHDFIDELESANVADYKIKFPAAVAKELEFKAFLTNFEPSGEVDGLLSADVTYKVSGPVTLSPVAGG